MQAFCRSDDKPIRVREPVLHPDAILIQDATLLADHSLLSGLTPGGLVLINSSKPREALHLDALLTHVDAGAVVILDATGIGTKHIGRPIPNSALLGGFAALTGQFRLTSLNAAFTQKFNATIARMNIGAAREAFEWIQQQEECAHA